MSTISQATIDARNTINAKAITVKAELVALLTPYLGKKVRKISGWGGWVAALSKPLEAYFAELKEQGFHAHAGQGVNWLHVDISSHYTTPEWGDRSQSVKQQLSLGKVDDQGVLLELYPEIELRTDYTKAEVEANRAEAYALEEKARAMRSTVREFERSY